MEDNQLLHSGVDISFDANAQAGHLARDDETSTRRQQTVDLVWKDLNFSVPLKTKRKKKGDDKLAPTSKTILQNISGHVRAGTMLAVMGSSGAGKTSLLNLLAGRLSTTKGATATGSVSVNGKPREYQQFKKLAAYVLQDDTMFGELTVEEQITYSALLRLPSTMERERKLARVERVVQELGLSKVRDTMIGNEMVRGISGGEKKRVNIGTELVTDPALLFLDEPTTGLDSFNALNVMTALRQLASNGRTIVSTIHQPRSSIFGLFDQLCLLSEGRVMYFGPASDAVAYFSGLNFHSPPHFNPADFFLDLLSIDPRSPEVEARTKARVDYLGNKYEQREHSSASPLLTAAEDVEQGRQDEDEIEAVPHDTVELRSSSYQSSWMNEFYTLCSRSVKLAFREKAANGARLGQVIFFSILLGLIWLNKGKEARDEQSATGFQSIAGIIFFIVINQAFGGAFSVIFGFPLERSVVTRERAANTYRTSSYYMSKTVTDLPKTFLFTVIFCAVVYWMAGLRSSASAFFFFVLIVFLVSAISESLAITVSIMTGDAQAAAALIPVFVIISVLFGGFFIGSDELDAWIGWLKYVSFVFYGFHSLLKNEFSGGAFAESAREALEVTSWSRWVDVAALSGYLVIQRLLGYLFLEYLQAPKFLKF